MSIPLEILTLPVDGKCYTDWDIYTKIGYCLVVDGLFVEYYPESKRCIVKPTTSAKLEAEVEAMFKRFGAIEFQVESSVGIELSSMVAIEVQAMKDGITEKHAIMSLKEPKQALMVQVECEKCGQYLSIRTATEVDKNALVFSCLSPNLTDEELRDMGINTQTTFFAVGYAICQSCFC